MEVLDQRREVTRLNDFEGNETRGLQFDSKRWDGHEYRRFSAVNAGPRPFSVVTDMPRSTPRVVFAGPEERRAVNVGIDSGHYRRLTWLHYTLRSAGISIGADWVDSDVLEGLANQFAYAIYWHPCHHLRKDGCSTANGSRGPEAVPRFVNYVSGQNGWYRLTPFQPCEPGVPPFGFSTLMVLSESLWWAEFNDDVTRIWSRLQAAANDPDLPPPSQGDSVACGEDAEKSQWNKTYHDMVFDATGRLTRHGLGLYAMKYWADRLSAS